MITDNNIRFYAVIVVILGILSIVFYAATNHLQMLVYGIIGVSVGITSLLFIGDD